MKATIGFALWAVIGIAGLSVHAAFGARQAATQRADAAFARVDAAERAAQELERLALQATRVRVALKQRCIQTGDKADAAAFTQARAAEKVAWDKARAAWAEVINELAPIQAIAENMTVAERSVHRLREARAVASSGKPYAAAGQIEQILDELDGAGLADSPLSVEAREARGTAFYQAALTFRTSGRAREEWQGLTAASRQQFRQMGEMARAAGNAEATARAEANVEIVLNLEQASADELEASPTPSECEQCKNPQVRPNGPQDNRKKSGGEPIEGPGW